MGHQSYQGAGLLSDLKVDTLIASKPYTIKPMSKPEMQPKKQSQRCNLLSIYCI